MHGVFQELSLCYPSYAAFKFKISSCPKVDEETLVLKKSVEAIKSFLFAVLKKPCSDDSFQVRELPVRNSARFEIHVLKRFLEALPQTLREN